MKVTKSKYFQCKNLAEVPDIIDLNLNILFIGINPGIKTSLEGHNYAGNTNHFWPCLSESGMLFNYRAR